MQRWLEWGIMAKRTSISFFFDSLPHPHPVLNPSDFYLQCKAKPRQQLYNVKNVHGFGNKLGYNSCIFQHKGCFPLCQSDWSETSGTNQGKMERHCSVDTRFPTGPKRSIYISTEISITSQWSGTGNENFWKWNRKFRSDRTDRSKRTTSGGGPLFSGKFPPGPKRSIYVSTEISGNFGIMQSTQRASVISNSSQVLPRIF